MTTHKTTTTTQQPPGFWTFGNRRSILTLTIVVLVVCAFPAFAAGTNPWENAVSTLQDSFTGPIAKGLSLVAIVVGGLMFAFGEGQSKRVFAGIVFGIGMAVGAVNFMAWLFPGG